MQRHSPPSRPAASSPDSPRRNSRDASIGAAVNEMTSDISVAYTTVKPNAKKNWPMMPFMKAIGVKTTTLVSADAATATPTSAVPRSAASMGSAP